MSHVGRLRIMIVDDNPVVRSGLAALLATDAEIEVVAEAGDGRRAVEAAHRLRPDLVLLDVWMPLMDGVTAAELLSKVTRVLMLTYNDDPDVVRAAFRNGAAGYLVHNSFSAETLVAAVRDTVRAGAHPLSAPAASALIDAVKAPPEKHDLHRMRFDLSDREIEIMDLIIRGRSNGEIAAELFLAEKTVKNHVNRIYAKLDVTSRAAAIAKCIGTA